MIKVLIVDDDKEIRTYLSEIMTKAGYEVTVTASGAEAVEKATEEDFDLVLLDLVMPKMSGADVLGELRRVSPKSRAIMITAFASIENAVEAVKRGASDYLTKPFKIEDLLIRVKRVLEEARIDSSTDKAEFDSILSALSNSTRRAIMQLLSQRGSMRLMEIVRQLGFDDHTKVIFHLKMLKEAKLIESDGHKSHSLTREGVKALESLKILEKHLH